MRVGRERTVVLLYVTALLSSGAGCGGGTWLASAIYYAYGP
jgi:hypothetical protein